MLRRELTLLYTARAAPDRRRLRRDHPSGLSSEIGFSAFQIGIVAAAALLGTAAATLIVGHLGARHDLRNLLLLGACMMIGSGIAFANTEHLVFVVLVAFFGTMNPSTGDLGMLVPLEHAMIARAVPDRERTKAFANYSLIGALAMAAGALAAATPDLLQTLGFAKSAHSNCSSTLMPDWARSAHCSTRGCRMPR